MRAEAAERAAAADDAAAEKARRNAKSFVPGVVLAASALGFLFLFATQPAVPMRPEVVETIAVTTTRAAFQTYQPEIQRYGEVTPGRRLEVRPKVGGEVVKISDGLKDGVFVEAGEELFELDRFKFESALADAQHRLNEANAHLTELNHSLEGEAQRLALYNQQLDLASRDVERAKSLVESRIAAERTRDDRTHVMMERQHSVNRSINQIDLWKALIEQQEAVIERLEENITLAERDLSDTLVKAPFPGFVDDVMIEAGRVVTAYEQVAVLIDANWLEVRFVMSNSQYGRILSEGETLIGRSVKVAWRLGGTLFEFDAKVERLGAVIDAASGGVEVFARLQGIDQHTPIRPGAFVEIYVPDRVYENVMRLPEAAIYDTGSVFVLGEEDRLRARTVNVLGRDGEHVFVTGAIDPGATVLTMRVPGIEEGVKVAAQ
ncbi:MAG: HlyD family efflux transporter periplasmic adaptor subunit [Pseudomonadota bacterium]